MPASIDSVLHRGGLLRYADIQGERTAARHEDGKETLGEADPVYTERIQKAREPSLLD